MKHSQTLAKELVKHFPTRNLNAIAGSGCCAFVLLWCLGIEPSDPEAIMILDDLINKKSLKDDCTVKWAEAVKSLTGRELQSVDFLETNVIGDIKGRTPVRFDYGTHSHWVGVENGVVAFNPLDYSKCVIYGRPVTKRVLHIKGVEL